MKARVGTGAPARPSRAKLGSCQRPQQLWIRSRTSDDQAVSRDRLIEFTITMPRTSKLSREITPSDMTQ